MQITEPAQEENARLRPKGANRGCRSPLECGSHQQPGTQLTITRNSVSFGDTLYQRFHRKAGRNWVGMIDNLGERCFPTVFPAKTFFDILGQIIQPIPPRFIEPLLHQNCAAFCPTFSQSLLPRIRWASSKTTLQARFAFGNEASAASWRSVPSRK